MKWLCRIFGHRMFMLDHTVVCQRCEEAWDRNVHRMYFRNVDKKAA